MVTLLSEKKSIVYDQLKIITIFLVVLGHCLIMFSPDGAIPVEHRSVVFTYLSSVLYRFHIPCFFMVSGGIFGFSLKKGKYNVFSSFLRKKAVRLLIPYGIFGVFVVLPVLIFCGLLEPSVWYAFFWNLFTGDQVRHLWYLYALFFIFFLVWPFRRCFTLDDWKTTLGASFAVSLLFRSLPFDFTAYFQIGNIFYYQFFFVCGIFVDLYFGRILCFFRTQRFIVPACCLLLVCSCFADFYTLTGYVYALAGTALAFRLALFLAEETSWFQYPWWQMVSRDSYGIYLFHPMIIYLIFYGFSRWSVFPLFLFLIVFFVSSAASLFLTEFCRRAGLGVIIGEGVKKRLGTSEKFS